MTTVCPARVHRMAFKFDETPTNKQQYIKKIASLKVKLMEILNCDVQLTYFDPSNIKCFHQNIKMYANSKKFLDK